MSDHTRTLHEPSDLTFKKLFGTPVKMEQLTVDLSPGFENAHDGQEELMAPALVKFSNGEERTYWFKADLCRRENLVKRVRLVEVSSDLLFMSTLLAYTRQVLYHAVGSDDVSERVRTQLGG